MNNNNNNKAYKLPYNPQIVWRKHGRNDLVNAYSITLLLSNMGVLVEQQNEVWGVPSIIQEAGGIFVGLIGDNDNHPIPQVYMCASGACAPPARER
jgi:hypothetical protein